MSFQLQTYSEIVISVKNIDAVLPIYTQQLGWDIFWRGKGDDSQISFWKLPPETETEEILLRFQGLPYGQIRLVQFENIAQKLIRPAGQTWDTGGILDIDLRTSDLLKVYQDLTDTGWHAYSRPITQTMGPFTVQEVLVKGHDEVVIALVHRSEPPHPNPFQLEGITSNVYLSAMIVRDLKTTAHFFINHLGFTSHNEITFKADKPETTMFGLPHNLADKTNIRLHIIGPTNNRDGLLDLVEIEGIMGEDFSENASPPNRGILMYRFPVNGINNYYDFIQKNGVKPVVNLQKIQLKPIGTVESFAVQSPDGVWLEFYEIHN
ncbi:MAG: VOC family protein [Arcicella sp.]|jgi:catechol 2,3-dioxygenase-like lactoylglutathione lyase family enzyme|nr:VOC family protein [Arcicella sp.]